MKTSRDTLIRSACLLLMVLLSTSAIPQPGSAQVRVGPDLIVAETEFGYVDASTGEIIASRRIDTSQHPGFGWRVKLEGQARTVRYREEFILPAPAKVWQVGHHTTVAPDRASAVTEGDAQLDGQMDIRNGWIHTPGDPKGLHVMRIWLDGVLVAEFDFILY